MTHRHDRSAPRTRFTRYRQTLWLLTRRDLKVRYSTSALGYLWSILDPLVMAGIYFFVFTVVFHRVVGEEPVHRLPAQRPPALDVVQRRGLRFHPGLPREAKLVRSTKIPRTIWVNRLVASKGIEFLFSLPVLALFAIVTGAVCTGRWCSSRWRSSAGRPLTGVGLIVAPLVVFFRDLERAVKLTLRFLFYASPIIYGTKNLPECLPCWRPSTPQRHLRALPLGVLPRAARLARSWSARHVRWCCSPSGSSSSELERAVLKEI